MLSFQRIYAIATKEWLHMVRDRLTANGMVLRPGSPEDLATFQAAEIDKWKRLVTAAGIELQ